MASRSENIFTSGPLFALVTGASQGLGRVIAATLAVKASTGSVISITARNLNGLNETVEIAKKKRQESGQQWDVSMSCVVADLSNNKDVISLVDSSISDHKVSNFNSAILVHNASTLGDITKEVCDFHDPDEVTDYFRLNVSHVPPITSKFLEWVQSAEPNEVKCVVINISSLNALQPSPCFSMYSTGKAARDMLFRVLAVENSKIKVLNWAPGPLLTSMAETIWATPNKHSTDKFMQQLRDDGKYLTCEQSTSKLIGLLEQDNFKSGDHVDVFDI